MIPFVPMDPVSACSSCRVVTCLKCPDAPEYAITAIFPSCDYLMAKWQEEHVMKMLKILTTVRDDLRNFYVPAWFNKVRTASTCGNAVWI